MLQHGEYPKKHWDVHFKIVKFLCCVNYISVIVLKSIFKKNQHIRVCQAHVACQGLAASFGVGRPTVYENLLGAPFPAFSIGRPFISILGEWPMF